MLAELDFDDDLFLQDLVVWQAMHLRDSSHGKGGVVEFKYVLRGTLVMIGATCANIENLDEEGVIVEYGIFDCNGKELPSLYEDISDEEDEAIKYMVALELGIYDY